MKAHMNGSGFVVTGLVAALVFVAGVRPAFGQLTPADIEALRARGQQEGWTFTVGENPATVRPLEELCGLVIPENWQKGARFDPCTPRRDLPADFNWCEQNGCPPIRDQDGCGSCWAFGTVGPLECNIMIKDGVAIDLSEQWLVSCNQSGWSCNGGWWAHDYHLGAVDPCNGTGAVLESAFPYVAADVPCDCPYPHAYLLDGWAFIGDSESVAPVDAIKQAILDHGPVSAAVYVNYAFQAYNGGIFNSCENGWCNHAVVLTGWDDSQGGGVWYLRNSWGPGWGEGGYMRIPYNCSNIGYATCYVQYGPLEAPDLVIQDSTLSPTVDINPGDLVSLTDVVANQGNASADSRFWVSWYISTDSNMTTDDLLWPSAWRYVAHLDPNEASAASYLASWPDEYPYNCPGRTYYVAVMADDENDIFESDESNNWGQVWTVTLGGTNEPPVLSTCAGWSEGVDPRQGDLLTEFTFCVQYADPEGTPALVAQVVIDGQPYDMTPGDESGYQLARVGADLGSGTHDYYFYFEDGCGATASLPADGRWQFTVVAPCDPQELAELFAPDYVASAGFGWSVALDSDTAVIGAPLDDPSGLTDAGSAYVFVLSGGVWTYQAKLTAPDAQAGDEFGYSVVLRGDRAVIGAPLADRSGAVDAGAAHVFVRSGTQWTPEAKLVDPNGAAGDQFGSAAAIEADTIVIGSPFDDRPGKTDAGSAHVFVRSGTGWSWQAVLTGADSVGGDHFGNSAAIAGDTAFVGASYDDTRTGAVYVFTRSNGSWTQGAKLRGNDSTAWGYFGTSVAVKQGALIVGSDGQYVGYVRTGEAYVFRQHGSVWQQEGGGLRASDGQNLDNFGWSVAIDGNVAIVGAFWDTHAGGTNAGAAYVFVRRDDGWVERNKLTASDGQAYAHFGSSVALDGNTALVGAYGYDLPGAADTGAAYLFDLGCMRTGDLNCDRTVDFQDINPFVLAMSNPSAYAQEFPYCDAMLGDINGDGTFDFGDINPFVELLIGGD